RLSTRFVSLTRMATRLFLHTARVRRLTPSLLIWQLPPTVGRSRQGRSAVRTVLLSTTSCCALRISWVMLLCTRGRTLLIRSAELQPSVFERKSLDGNVGALFVLLRAAPAARAWVRGRRFAG